MVPEQIPGYGVDELVWALATAEEPIRVNGTVYEVKAQLAEFHPKLAFGFIARFTGVRQRRADFSDSQNLCNQNNAQWPRIDRCIRSLRKVSGRPMLAPGPGRCSRVSEFIKKSFESNDRMLSLSTGCSFDSATWWYNDDLRNHATMNLK